MSRSLGVIVFVALLLVACGASSEVDSSTETAVESAPVATGAETSEPAETEAGDVPASESTVAPTAEPTPQPTPEPVVEEVLLVPSATAVTLLSPASGEGTRPLLAWQPVDGAEHYAVSLFAPDGRIYWASLVIETQTFVGGPEQIAEDQPGPRVIDGMTWMVVAYDDDQLPIAVSGQRPIAP